MDDDDDVGDIDTNGDVETLANVDSIWEIVKYHCEIAELFVNIVVVNGDARHSGHGDKVRVIWVEETWSWLVD